jgi:ABC-type uncharacterized transport system involved in gliding motility auxiliary subunit
MSKYYRFLVYIGVFLLINLAATTLFFRIDLTKDGLYSISEVSKKVVSTLSEPLTIHVFFTKNLPAPHNNTERYLHDLLAEYGIYGNKYFNYQFHDVSVKDRTSGQGTNPNQEMAGNYGIYPVQIQNIEKDEVKFQKAYMGMALIHGDMIEKIPTITTTEGLEFKITSAIQKMNNKISALLRLTEKIRVKLYLSSSLEIVAPYINISGLSQVPDKLKSLVNKLSDKHYGKLDFSSVDPTKDQTAMEEQHKYNLFRLKWEKQVDRLGKEIPEGIGVAGLVMEYGQKSFEVQLIQAIKVPIFGTQYKLLDMEKIESVINNGIEDLIEINENIGYLSGHGTLPLMGGYGLPNQPKETPVSNFNNVISRSYTLKQINLKDSGILPDINCMIISRPRSEFSDYELFQIDQFLMQGKNLAIFLDAFNEIRPNRQNQQYFSRNQGPFYIPLKTGLEKLLNHYGITLKNSYVMDESCFKQRVDQRYGGGEQPIYFAPLIKGSNISNQYGFMKNIERMIMVKISPLELDEKKIKNNGIQAKKIFSSSKRSWEMSGRINLNPYFIQKPASDDQFKSLPLAYILEGQFPSYFADKPVPEKPVKEDLDEVKDKEKDKKGEEVKKPDIDLSKIKKDQTVIKKGKAAKIFLIGTSEIIKNNIIDEAGQSPNAIFISNTIDYLNNREDIALMRGKHQRFNLLEDTKSGTKAFFKTFNILGLPLLVVLAGVFIWMRRKTRKKKIQLMFRK